jgi:tyrosyl-tRNA synthetase
MTYNFETLKQAILFNTIEVLPTDDAQLDSEIRFLIEQSTASGQPIRHYIGFEISGKIHIGGGLFQMIQAAKLQQAGVEIVLWMADYHTWLNSKLDGKMSTIHKAAKEYFAPQMLNTLASAGGDPKKAIVLFNYEDYRKIKDESTFWDYEFECDANLSLNRILRSLSITGKSGGDEVNYKLTRYPGMQAADVFWLQTHIVQSGLDQRKIYVSTRDIADKVDEKYRLKINNKNTKPICTFSTLLYGLQPPQINQETGELEVSKMSKSKPDTCIFMEDGYDEIFRKIKKAYCPMPNLDTQSQEQIAQEQGLNPILNWIQNIVFPIQNEFEISNRENQTTKFATFEELNRAYCSGQIHPLDLKTALAKCLDKFLSITRNWASQNPDKIEYIDNARK